MLPQLLGCYPWRIHFWRASARAFNFSNVGSVLLGSEHSLPDFSDFQFGWYRPSEPDILGEKLHSGMKYGIHKAILFHIQHLASKRYSRRIDCVNLKNVRTERHSKTTLRLYSRLWIWHVIIEKYEYMDGNGKPLICKFDDVVPN